MAQGPVGPFRALHKREYIGKYIENNLKIITITISPWISMEYPWIIHGISTEFSYGYPWILHCCSTMWA
ncbi:MAG: hypothetical protein QGG48_07990 [Desulfatiglandales bacterium]|nr:hypothetical protein [Desulfatiglandales bacterium]